MPSPDNSQRRQTAVLVTVAVAMFGFAFALVPLYDVFCELTGLNGKTEGQVAVDAGAEVDTSRDVVVQFVARVARGMPWEFRPTQFTATVHPGEIYTTSFYVRNRAGRRVTGQAVPSVTPGMAAQYLRKTECFCFEQQQLEAGEELKMALTFYVDADLPADVGTLSLSYTLFRVPDAQSAGVEQPMLVAGN